MKIKSWMGYYVGGEFPEYYGREIEISDCHKDKNNPCYQILFVGEHYWHDNMSDDDWQVIKPCVVVEVVCKERNCENKAVIDYNGHGHFVCEQHYDSLTKYFEEEYK